MPQSPWQRLQRRSTQADIQIQAQRADFLHHVLPQMVPDLHLRYYLCEKQGRYWLGCICVAYVRLSLAYPSSNRLKMLYKYQVMGKTKRSEKVSIEFQRRNGCLHRSPGPGDGLPPFTALKNQTCSNGSVLGRTFHVAVFVFVYTPAFLHKFRRIGTFGSLERPSRNLGLVKDVVVKV